MKKLYVDKTVYEAARERIAYIFKEFDSVLVAFSGGKDSSVVLHMAYDYAMENGCLDRLGMYHLDYEAQYRQTTDYVTDVFTNQFPGIRKYWFCMPIFAQCACRMDGPYWTPWNENEKDIWTREMPENEYVVNAGNYAQVMGEDAPTTSGAPMKDYEFQDRISDWYGRRYGKAAVLIGIRADESMNRFRAIAGNHKVNQYNGRQYITMKTENAYNCYPIYDWSAEDDFIYFGKFGKSYNKLYDLYFQAGLTVDQMRVASPFNDCAMGTLKLYKSIDPDTWGKMIGRVNGVNMAGLYGGTTAMGWKNITKPAHFTWKEYCYFLLSTLDEPVREHYLKNLNTSIKFWASRGGGLDDDTIEELRAEGAKIEVKGATSKQTKKQVVTFEEYPDDTTAKAFKDIPSYKRMCVCILKNDWHCKYMGFAPTKEYQAKRKATMEKWKKLL
ncbi:MAG: DUF3440 domain-containing protein [Lachnospiraceae bacterium]|nr:DUF3440 domain-containing protein [Lachnospiraceae bacterium]